MNIKLIRDHIKSLGILEEEEQYDVARLIINDAIKVIKRRYMGDNNREDMEVLRCVEDLKAHFGVE